MAIIKIIFIITGIILLAGMGHYLIEIQRPRIYPPKRIMKERAVTLGGTGFFLLFLGFLLSLMGI